MAQVTLGRTGITVEQNAFGALPIQRISFEAAGKLLLKAYEGGMHFFDTARSYTDSEEKIGAAFGCPGGLFETARESVYIATKTPSVTVEGFWKDLETSLRNMRTDYVDILQFHNPSFCPKPGDGTGLYEAALEAKTQGKIRFIGITNHRMAVAEEAVESGLYDTLQYPFSYVASDREIELVEKCKAANVGFIAMKGLAGGLLTNSKAAYAFIAQFDNVLPIWGVQREWELDEFLSYIENPPVMEGELKELIEKDKASLIGDFCRSCGYCMPCPAGIEIRTVARMSQLIRRAPSAEYLGKEWQAEMKLVESCKHCNLCRTRCPYSLNVPELLKKNYEDYKEILAGKDIG